MYMDKEGTTLATEIFQELKASARRWFIAFLIMCGIEAATIAGFLWYISLPVDEVSIDSNAGNALYVGDGNDLEVDGGIQNGTNNTPQKGSAETQKVTETVTEVTE